MICDVLFMQKSKYEIYEEPHYQRFENVEQVVSYADGSCELAINDNGYITIEKFGWVVRVTTLTESN